ncbi:AMP-binding protein [Cupriavidus sp. 2TAF22]|uniref:AMP-binding protein n=1 Tax=unclassified Cupriavidus TaxID=2640874 RepID=UPI003F906D49
MSYPKIIFSGRVFTPEWMEAEVERVSAGLQAAGVQHGQTVAVMMRNCPAYAALILACRRAGVYFVSLNWHCKAPEAAFMLEDSGAGLLFVHDDLIAQVIAGVPERVAIVSVSADEAKPLPDVSGRAASWATFGVGAPPMAPRPRLHFGSVQYTSGTTGKPKGVRRLALSPEVREELEQESRRIGRIASGMAPGVTAMLCAPIYHSASTQYLVQACDAGATLILEPAFDALRTLQLIEQHAVTHAYLVPTMYRRLLALGDAERVRHSVATLRHVASTGSPCAPEVKRRMIEWFGPVITEAYGASETGYVTFIDSPTWLENPGSVGRALGPAKLRILDDEGQPLLAGQVGAIYVRQPALPDFTYVNNQAARDAMEMDGLVGLGDVGYLDTRGFLYICDRRTDMIISGGVNIYPAEVEAVLQGMPGVADCAVFGIPDDEYGEAVAAAVQLRPGARLDASGIKAFLREHVANFKVPRVIDFHAALPREDTGKIFKRLLREPYWRDQARRI